jgi:hypothetical protein
MKISITENQFMVLKRNLMFEQETEKILYLDKKIDFSKLNTIDEIKDAIKIVGLQHSKGSQSRGLPKEIEILFQKLDELTDKSKFEHYFKILINLMSRYKSGSFTLRKLKELLESLLLMGEDEMEEKINHTIEIFSDSRFSERNKKSLIKLLTASSRVDFSDFFDKTIRKFREYEVSFLDGDSSPFVGYFTSPRMRINLIKDYNFGDVTFSKIDFNSQKSDVERAAYLIKKLSEIKTFRPVETLMEEVLLNLKFGFDFPFTEKNIKADLVQISDLLSFDSKLMRTTIIGKKGQFVEIKNNAYNKPYYLSEFFKVDASGEAEIYLVDLISKIPKIKDPKSGFAFFMYLLAQNFRRTLLGSGEGEKIINHLTDNLSGMIFSNDIFIPKKDLTFYWNIIGYAKKPRISIFYSVSDDADVFRIEKNENGYTNKLKKIS